MNIVNIALASSIVEFDAERQELQRRIERLRELLAKRKIQVQFEVWRGHPKYDPEAQKEYNERIRQSQFFFAIIGRAVGKHTKREIGVAHAQRKESGDVGRPLIKIFFRDLKPEEELTPEEILSEKKEPPENMKSWAVTMGYCVTFSKFEELYGRIIMELIMHGVIFTECKTRWGAEWKIRENRRQIRKLSAESDEVELSIRYMENVTLSEAWDMDWNTLYEYAVFLHRRGYNENALEIGKRLDEHYTADDKPDERAALKRLLGDCQMSQGEHEAAEPCYRDALALYRELAERKGKYRADAAELCAKLAEIMRMTFRYEAAERLYREALEHYLGDAERYAREIGLTCHAMQQLMGPQRQEQAAILHRAEQTATYCAVQRVGGRMGDVRENLRRWMETYPRPDSVTPRMRDAEAQALEQTKDKPEDYERALAAICWNTAKWLREHNQMETAEAFAHKALEIRRSSKDKSSVAFEQDMTTSLNLLAMITQDTNRPRESEQRFQEAIEINRRLVVQDPHTFEWVLATSYSNLGTLLVHTNRYEDAECYYQEALEIFRRLAKQDSNAFKPDLARTCLNLGNLLCYTQQYEKAERYYRETLEIRRRLTKRNSDAFEPVLANVCLNMAIMLKTMTRYDEAELYYRESLEIYRRRILKDPLAHETDLARAYYNYGAYLLEHRQNPDAAKEYLDKAIALYEKYPHYKERLDEAISARNLCQYVIHGGY